MIAYSLTIEYTTPGREDRTVRSFMVGAAGLAACLSEGLRRLYESTPNAHVLIMTATHVGSAAHQGGPE